MDIQRAAEKEGKRMQKLLLVVDIAKPQGRDLVSFAKNYSKDAFFFLEHEKFVEAFEAAVIAWAYIDIGIKLKLLTVPNKYLENFTVDKA